MRKALTFYLAFVGATQLLGASVVYRFGLVMRREHAALMALRTGIARLPTVTVLAGRADILLVSVSLLTFVSFLLALRTKVTNRILLNILACTTVLWIILVGLILIGHTAPFLSH